MFKAIARFFRSLFSKDSETRTPEPYPRVEPPKPSSGKKKIALIVGHSTRDKGAVAYTGEAEWDYNNKVALKVAYYLKQKQIDVRVFYRDGGKSYRSAMKDIAKNVSSWGADFSLEFHFNSYVKKAYGCEILVAYDANNFEDTIRKADYWTDVLAQRFRLRQRHKVKFKDSTYGDGVKVCKYKERGYWNLAYLADYGVPMSFLIEPMFANLKTEESQGFFENAGRESYVRYLVDMISEL